MVLFQKELTVLAEDVTGGPLTNFPLLISITDSDLQLAVKLINNRPRKRLEYHTPKEIFLGKIAFRTRI